MPSVETSQFAPAPSPTIARRWLCPARTCALSVTAALSAFASLTALGFDRAAARPRVEPPAGAVALASAPSQTVELTLPFDGIWGVVQGFDSGQTHVGYAAYALDFVPAERLDGAVPAEKRHRLADFPCYGRRVLAPADGKVVWAKSDAPDRPAHNNVKREAGNFVILEHAVGEYTELRHLQSGSVAVRVGQRVTRGQEIARCGNSGNAKTPHLHVGFLGSVDPIATRPMRLSRYQILGPDGTWRLGDGVPLAGQILRNVPRVPTETATPRR